MELTSLASVSRSVASPLLSTLQYAESQEHGCEHRIETACNNSPDALASLPAGELLLLECGWLAVEDISAHTQQSSAPALLHEGWGCQRWHKVTGGLHWLHADFQHLRCPEEHPLKVAA